MGPHICCVEHIGVSIVPLGLTRRISDANHVFCFISLSLSYMFYVLVCEQCGFMVNVALYVGLHESQCMFVYKSKENNGDQNNVERS